VNSLSPSKRRRVLVHVVTAATIAVCAGLLTAAVLVPAPLPVIPLVAAVTVGLPVTAAYERSRPHLGARAAARRVMRRRDLRRLRRQLRDLPETRHPLDL
jgi:hypothetical protein